MCDKTIRLIHTNIFLSLLTYPSRNCQIYATAKTSYHSIMQQPLQIPTPKKKKNNNNNKENFKRIGYSTPVYKN
jgi:hypothetical protein